MNIFIFLITLIGFLFITQQAHAVCPVCTVAVAFGLGLSRYIGVDDILSGIWIGGLIISSGLWTADWLKKRKWWKLPFTEYLSTLIFFLLIVPPLYWMHMIGVHGNTLWNIDKIILGTTVGSILFLLGVLSDKLMRRLNHGKVFFYYQKVLMPILFLTLATFIFYQFILV